jgi:hypothetical protein
MLNGVLWVLMTGSPWRDLPERYGPWQTVYTFFKNLRASGVFDAILSALHLRLDRQGKIDWDPQKCWHLISGGMILPADKCFWAGIVASVYSVIVYRTENLRSCQK